MADALATALADAGVTLRPITPDDEPLLLRLYALTRAPEMALVPWTDEQKQAFLQMQFNAQHAYYHEKYPGASFDVIDRDGAGIGRLYVERADDEIRILDGILLSEHREQGIGTALLQGLMDEARAAGLPLRMYLEAHNTRARQLFERLGFEVEEDGDAHVLYVWRAR